MAARLCVVVQTIVVLWGIEAILPGAEANESSEPQKPRPEISFEADIRPILKAHCFHCHGEDGERESGLDLRLRRFLAAGGDSGPAIVAGEPDHSLLLERVRSGEMPPGEKDLSKQDVDLLSRWIALGAPTLRPEPEQLADDEPFITEEERSFWSFQPIRRPTIPEVQQAERVRTPIDAFLQSQLEAAGGRLNPDADRRTLIRRATFDLLGLPPTPEEVEEFLSDESPDAYERLIDRLLESPHYGERWGRHWLDVAGYSDSEGGTNEDRERKYAYKYRDYVIRAFNDDMPFDRFIQEQLAGDEMIPSPPQNLTADEIDKLVATGFLRMAPDGTDSGGLDPTVARNQVIADTLQIVSTSLLGLTVACAQCHDHRYDPIPTVDYYRMRAIFEPAYDWKQWRTPSRRLISLYTDADREQAAAIEAEAKTIDEERARKQQEYIDRTFEQQLSQLPEELHESLRAAWSTPPGERTDEQKKLLQEYPSVNVTAGSLYLYDREAADDLKREAARATELRATKPVEEFVRAMTEIPDQIPTTSVFHRGDPDQPKQAVAAGELTVLRGSSEEPLPENDPAVASSGRRLAYARWLTSGRHPLTARVLMNRVWHHYFGRGIVATPADFGFLGERPTHPELLDWMADEFMKGNWRLKRMHRQILLSTAYRQASTRTGWHAEHDPDNRLVGRMPVRRLEAEIIRDAILAISGSLNPKPFGKAIPVMEDEVGQFVVGIENKNGENRPGPVIPLEGEEFRRSLYVQTRRTRPLSLMESFDLPVMEPNCEVRNSSTVAPQSLLLMNNEFVVDHAAGFARRVREQFPGDVEGQLRAAWMLAFARSPADEELRDAVQFLTEQTAWFSERQATADPEQSNSPDGEGEISPELQALATLCQVLLSSNEFLYVD